jgi:hypothetical protein
MAVDERRQRIRRNMARAWAYAAAAYAASPTLTASLAAPELVSIGTRVLPARTSNLHSTASLSIGTASANRRVFVAAFTFYTTNPITKASIGGVAATIHSSFASQLDANNAVINIMSADVPTGEVVSFSASFGAGAFGTMVMYTFVADKSAFENASPVVRTFSGMSFDGSPLIASITHSANSCILAVVNRDGVGGSDVVTVSPSANFSYTKIDDVSPYLKFLFANGVAAQTSTIPAHAVTSSQTAYISVISWR